MLPQRSVCIKFHASCSPMAHTRCVNYAFEWYFVLVFCLCFVYKFIITTQNYNIFHYILESVYWFHSTPPMCLFGVVPVTLSSGISQWIICHILSVHEVISVANQNPLAGIDLYKVGRNLDRSDLTELPLRYQNYKWWAARRNVLWQDFQRYGTHFR